MIQPLPFKDNAEGKGGFYIGIFMVGTEERHLYLVFLSYIVS